jgi:hypothetical protein
VFGLLLLAVLPHPAPIPCAGDAEIETILAQARDPSASAPELGRRLAILGSDAIPDLYAVLVRGSTTQGGELCTLQEDALLDGLASFGRSVLHPFLEARIEAASSLEERMAILSLFGRIGAGPDFGLMIHVGKPDPTIALEGPARQGFEDAVAAILGRDASAGAELSRWILRSTADVYIPLALAATRRPTEAVLESLADCLGFDRSLDVVLLAQIGRIGEALDQPVSTEVAIDLERCLDEDEPELLREAARAAGRLEDFEAAERLVLLLDHEDGSVREASAWALERMSGRRFRSDVARWNSWLRAELRWFEQEFARLAPRFEQGETAVVLRTLGQVSQHRFQRHRLAQEVEIALIHDDPVVRRVACVCLARLGSSAVRTGLLDALEDPNESVVSAARAALRSIGVEAPEPAVPN